MGIHFGGFDIFEDRLKQVEDQGVRKMDMFVRQEAEVVLGRVKENTPTDTGRLKTGWKRSRAVQGKVDIYNNVDYATHVEYGHRTPKGGFVKGRKMLHRGLLQASKSFEADCEAIFKNILGG